MPFEEGNELFFKRVTPMVLGLVLNVSLRVVDLRNADAEGAVACLPSKVVAFGECVVNPFEEPPLTSCIAFATCIVDGSERRR